MTRIARRFLGSPEGLAGALLLGAILAAALAAPLLFPGDPRAIAGPALLPPFSEAAFPLGTDRLGRDVAAGLIHGARISLLVGVAAAAAAALIGALVGTVAGLAGGVVDQALMRLVEAFQIVPAFLLALAFVSVAGASLGAVILAIALGAWTGPARLARAEVLSIRSRDFVAAARVLGMHPAEIALTQVLPLALPPVLALSAFLSAGAILIEAALSFLGLGDPNVVTWGAMIAEGRNLLRTAPWLSLVPGIGLAATVTGVYLFSEGLIAALARQEIRA